MKTKCFIIYILRNHTNEDVLSVIKIKNDNIFHAIFKLFSKMLCVKFCLLLKMLNVVFWNNEKWQWDAIGNVVLFRCCNRYWTQKSVIVKMHNHVFEDFFFYITQITVLRQLDTDHFVGVEYRQFIVFFVYAVFIVRN